MVWPLLAIGGLAVRALPWIAGAFIVNEVTGTIDTKVKDANNTPSANGNGAANPSGRGEIFGPFLPSTDFNTRGGPVMAGFENAFSTSNLVKLALISGVSYVAFKALQEGKKLI